MLKLSDQEPKWNLVLKGIRERQNYSQRELSEEIGISRRQIGKYERNYRSPIDENKEKIRGHVDSLNCDTATLEKLGEDYEDPDNLRTITEPAEVNLNEDAAELVGVILGDGEVSSDRSIRVSYNPHNEVRYIEQRTKKLIKKVIKADISNESERGIATNSKKFVLWLKEKGITPGSRFGSKWEIEEEFVKRKDLRRGLLRGLFDTDGTIYFDSQRKNIAFGRFSDRSTEIVETVEKCLEEENIKHRTSQSKDGRWKVRISDSVHIRKFFLKIGSSNYKHIARFIGWRDLDKQIKTSGRELEEILEEAKLQEIEVPFKSDSLEDRKIVEGQEFREENNVSAVVEDIYQKKGYEAFQEHLEVSQRTIRKWRSGNRTPGPKKCYKISQMRYN